MPGLKQTTASTAATKNKPANSSRSESINVRGKKSGPGSGRKRAGGKGATHTRTIVVRDFATQKPSLKNLDAAGKPVIASTGIRAREVPAPRVKQKPKPDTQKEHADITGVISTVPIVLPQSKTEISVAPPDVCPRSGIEPKRSKATTSVYDALLATRSFSILEDKVNLDDRTETETVSVGKQESFEDLVVQGDKITNEPPAPTHRPRDRGNVSQGGLEVRRAARMRTENARIRNSMTALTSSKPPLVASRLSDQSFAARRKFQETTYIPDPRLKLCGIKSREPPQQIIENGRRLLQRTQRRASAAPRLLSAREHIPQRIKTPRDDRSHKEEESRRGQDTSKPLRPSHSAVVLSPKSAKPSLVTTAREDTGGDSVIEIPEDRPPLNLSTIELKAATIRDHIDPLELREEAILDAIRNPNDDINSKTLSRLLGERRTVPLGKLTAKIWEKVTKSHDLISPRQSVASVSTSASSGLQGGAAEGDNSSETVSALDSKKKKKKKAKRRSLKKGPRKVTQSSSNLALSAASSSDLQMQICLERQQELEAKVAQFLDEMRQKIESSKQTACSPETLQTLESLVKTQSEIVNMQMDLKRRYMEHRWGDAYGASSLSVNTEVDADGRTYKEPILNAFNLDYGRLASYARETDGKIEFYCPTCKVSCENEMKFRLHLEGSNHVAKAHKELQSNQPWYNCGQCKTQIQGTTQYLSHMVEKKHNVNGKHSQTGLAVSVLENKRSFHSTR